MLRAAKQAPISSEIPNAPDGVVAVELVGAIRKMVLMVASSELWMFVYTPISVLVCAPFFIVSTIVVAVLSLVCDA